MTNERDTNDWLSSRLDDDGGDETATDAASDPTGAFSPRRARREHAAHDPADETVAAPASASSSTAPSRLPAEATFSWGLTPRVPATDEIRTRDDSTDAALGAGSVEPGTSTENEVSPERSAPATRPFYPPPPVRSTDDPAARVGPAPVVPTPAPLVSASEPAFAETPVKPPTAAPAPAPTVAPLSAPLHPAPLDPAPLDPAPLDSAPLDPAPLNSAPLDSAPLDSAPLNPAAPSPVDLTPIPTIEQVLDAPSPRRAAREAAAREAAAREAAAREAAAREAAAREAAARAAGTLPAQPRSEAPAYPVPPLTEPVISPERARVPEIDPGDATSAPPVAAPDETAAETAAENAAPDGSDTTAQDGLRDRDERAPGADIRHPAAGSGVEALFGSAPTTQTVFGEPDAGARGVPAGSGDRRSPEKSEAKVPMAPRQKALIAVAIVLVIVLIVVILLVVGRMTSPDATSAGAVGTAVEAFTLPLARSLFA